MITKEKYERAKETLLGDGIPMVANTDAQYLLELIESLRNVARAAEARRGTRGGELEEALDALPAWVLEENT